MGRPKADTTTTESKPRKSMGDTLRVMRDKKESEVIRAQVEVDKATERLAQARRVLTDTTVELERLNMACGMPPNARQSVIEDDEGLLGPTRHERTIASAE